MSSHSDSTEPSSPAHRRSAQGAQQEQLKELLRLGEQTARAGRRSEARRLFREALLLDPTNEDAWLWLGYLAPDWRQSLDYLRQAQTHHPRSSRAQQAVAWAEKRLAESGDSPARRHALPERAGQRDRTVRLPAVNGARPQAVRIPPERAQRRWRHPPAAPAPAGLVMIGLALLAVLVAYALRLPAEERTAEPPVGPGLSVVTADMAALRELASQAIAEEDWAQTIPLLGRMQELAPDDDGVRQQLAVSHLRRGLQLADQGHLDEAIAHYDAAIRFYANDVDLQTARRLAIGYRDGRQALDEERWDQAAELLEPVYKLAPDFRDVADLLFTTYVQQAASLEGAERLEAARDAYARAVEIRPGAGEVRARLAEIASILTPPTPTPTPRPRKRIVISVSEQRLRAYEDEALVFDWLCSTGDMARPTRYGEFEVLNKIPEAWSSVWGLRMPYWLGIYWAGGSQNGIHALPIDRSGQQLWAGFLGHRVSYGCVILDTPNAARLYDWAEIGTPVTIEP